MSFDLTQEKRANMALALGQQMTESTTQRKDAPRPKEEVNHPDHYGGEDNPYECIKVMKAIQPPEAFKGAMEFNVFKYVWRWREKGGIESLKKAIFYLQALVKVLEEERDNRKDLDEKVA